MKTNNSDNQEFYTLRKSLGEHIQKLRKLKHLTQEDLAELSGLDRVSIGYIEQGIRAPKLSTLYTIAKVLEVKLSQLFNF